MMTTRPGNQDDEEPSALGAMAVNKLFHLPWPKSPVGKGAKTGPRHKPPTGRRGGRGGRGRTKRAMGGFY